MKKIMEKEEEIKGCTIVYLQTGGNISILQYEEFYADINIAADLYCVVASSATR